MIFSSICPSWFLGFDALLQVLFVLVTGLVGSYSYRIHRLSGERRYLWWGVGFLSLSGAYAVSAFSNYYLYARLAAPALNLVPTAIDSTPLHLAGHLAHVSLFIAGYLLLAVVSLRFDDRRLIPLFATITALLAVALVAADEAALFTVAIVLLLANILYNYWRNTPGKYEKRPRKEGKGLRSSVIAGFALILAGNLAFLLIPLAGSAYVLGHLLELAGFALIAASMVRVLK